MAAKEIIKTAFIYVAKFKNTSKATRVVAGAQGTETNTGTNTIYTVVRDSPRANWASYRQAVRASHSPPIRLGRHIASHCLIREGRGRHPATLIIPISYIYCLRGTRRQQHGPSHCPIVSLSHSVTVVVLTLTGVSVGTSSAGSETLSCTTAAPPTSSVFVTYAQDRLEKI